MMVGSKYAYLKQTFFNFRAIKIEKKISDYPVDCNVNYLIKAKGNCIFDGSFKLHR